MHVRVRVRMRVRVEAFFVSLIAEIFTMRKANVFSKSICCGVMLD